MHLEHVPVEDVIIGEALAVEQVAKQLPQIAEKEKVLKLCILTNGFKYLSKFEHL